MHAEIYCLRHFIAYALVVDHIHQIQICFHIQRIRLGGALSFWKRAYANHTLRR